MHLGLKDVISPCSSANRRRPVLGPGPLPSTAPAARRFPLPFAGVGGLNSRVPPPRSCECHSVRLAPCLPKLLAYLPLLSAEALAITGPKIVVGPWEEAEKSPIRRFFFVFLVDYVDCRFRISDAAKGARTVIAEVVFMYRMHSLLFGKVEN